jgi:hypothetical protein
MDGMSGGVMELYGNGEDKRKEEKIYIIFSTLVI